MSALLQELLVGAVVAGCALYSVWRLASGKLRLRILALLGELPGARGAAWLGRLRAQTLRAGGCGGCAGVATPGAASRNQTPGGLRR